VDGDRRIYRDQTVALPTDLGANPARLYSSQNPQTKGQLIRGHYTSLESKIASGTHHETIELRTLDEEEGRKAPDLIKVDVEGSELEVLKGGAHTLERRPTLFLEIHGAGLEDKRRRVCAIVDYLWDLGYRISFTWAPAARSTRKRNDSALRSSVRPQ